MAKDSKLSDIEEGKTYSVVGFTGDDIAYVDHLQRMGFSEGTTVKKGSSNFKDPFSLVFRGGRIALRKKEAACVIVKEIGED